jgi:hypothetical protein
MRGLAKISRTLIGVKFEHCSTDKNKGLDCFTNIVEYLNMLGAGISQDIKYKGVSFDYRKEYKANPHKTMQLAHEYIASIAKEIKNGFETAGDILVMKTRKRTGDPIHLGIDAGNGSVIVAVRDKDITILSKKYFRVEKVYRWEQK